MLMGYAGQISLGHAAFYGLGAYASAILTVKLGLSPWIAMLLGILVTGTMAYLIGKIIFRLSGHYLAVATLGLGIVVFLAFDEFGELTGGPTGLPGVPQTVGRQLRLRQGYRVLLSGVGRADRADGHFAEHRQLARRPRPARHPCQRSRRRQHGHRFEPLQVAGAGAQRHLRQHCRQSLRPLHAFRQPDSRSIFTPRCDLVVMAAVGGLASVWGAPFGAAAIILLDDGPARYAAARHSECIR